MAVTVNDASEGVRLTVYDSPYACVLEFGSAKQMSDWAVEQMNAWGNESSFVSEIASKESLQLRGQAFQYEVQQFAAIKASLEPFLSDSQSFKAAYPKKILAELGREIDRGNVLVYGQIGTNRVLALKESDPEAYFLASVPSNTANAHSYRVATQNGSPISLKSISKASNARFPPTLQSIDPENKQLTEERDRWKAELAIQKQQVAELREVEKEIKALEKTYREGLKLNASVTYWTSRARWQTAGAVLAFGLFISLVTLYVILAWLYVLPFVETIRDNPDAGTQLTVIDIAITTLPSLAFFWLLRLVARLYVQCLSRLGDARDRATIVRTYLALCEDTKTQPSEPERLILIRSVSRPGPGDALEETAPDTILDQALNALMKK